MAKARKKSAVKRKKKGKVSRARKSGIAAKAKRPAKRKAKTKAKRARKAKPQTFGQRIVHAVEEVTETLREARELRNRLEPPASSETQ